MGVRRNNAIILNDSRDSDLERAVNILDVANFECTSSENIVFPSVI